MLNKKSNFNQSTSKDLPESPNRTLFLKRLLQFKLRTMLLLMLLASIWLAWHLDRAKKQERAVEGVANAGGSVMYDFKFDGDPVFANYRDDARSPYPKFVLDAVGYDFLHSVVSIELGFNEDSKKQSTEWAEHLEGVKNLRHVSMRGNQVDDEVLKSLGKLKHLRSVEVCQGFSITDKGIQDLVKSRKIKSVIVQHGALTDESLRHLSTLPEIECINLQGNCLSDKGLNYLQDKTKLSELWVGLSKNNITDRGLEKLFRLKNITELGIQSIDATQDEVDLLKQQLAPACSVHYFPKN